MSWLSNISNRHLGFHTWMPVEDYHEWIHTGTLKPQLFTKGSPDPHDIPSGHVAVYLSDIGPYRPCTGGVMPRVNVAYKPVAVLDVFGDVKTPQEVLAKVARLEEKFSRRLDRFRMEFSSQRYAVAKHNDDEMLYRLQSYDNDGPTLARLGEPGKFFKDAKDVSERQLAEPKPTWHKARDLSSAMRFSDDLTFLRESELLDGVKMDRILQQAGSSGAVEFKTSWRDCLLLFDKEAESLRRYLDHISNMEWVQALREGEGDGLQIVR